MKLPELKKPDKYVGLYVVDFGDHSGVGYTAVEVAELLDSEKYKDVKVYKIHNVYPDGRMELKGVPAEIFELESAMLFYFDDENAADKSFEELISLSIRSSPPCRAKVHLAQYSENKVCVALIYPAEYEEDISSWLLDIDYKTQGPIEGGVSVAQGYYDANANVIKRHQLFAKTEYHDRTGDELLAATKLAIQR